MRPAQIDQMWKKLGWHVNPASDHVKAQLWVDGKLILFTRRSHGSGKLSGLIPDKIRQQMKLNDSQFADAINCPLQKADYFAILRARGVLP